jgi:hypothetical protein
MTHHEELTYDQDLTYDQEYLNRKGEVLRQLLAESLNRSRTRLDIVTSIMTLLVIAIGLSSIMGVFITCVRLENTVLDIDRANEIFGAIVVFTTLSIILIATYIIGAITVFLVITIGNIDQYSYNRAVKSYKAWWALKILSLPPNQRDAIYDRPIIDGRWLVDFHDEYKVGRYYTKHWYETKCPAENPFTGQPILDEEVTVYLANVDRTSFWSIVCRYPRGASASKN